MKKYFFIIPITLLLFSLACLCRISPKEDINHMVMLGDRISTAPVLDLVLDESDARAIMDESKGVDLTGYCVAYNEYGKELGNFNLEYIHSRGHNSFKEVKKGYSLCFSEKANLYNMGKAKKYVLLPCYRDTSFLPYLIKNQIDEEIDFDYCMERQPVHVNLNEEYIGLYLLTEKIELGPTRVDVLSPGAFIVELADVAFYNDGNPDTEGKEIVYIGNERFIIRDYLGTTSEKVVEKLQEAYDALSDEDLIWEYWDIDSTAKLIATGLAATEVSYSSSVYFVYDPLDKKMHALPFWDAEHSYICGENPKCWDLEKWYSLQTPYAEIYTYFENNQQLENKIKEVYKDSLRDALINVRDNLQTDYFSKYNNDQEIDHYVYGVSDKRPMDVNEKNESLQRYFDTIFDTLDKDLLE